MDRRSEILKFIRPDHAGIEIAPWFNPLTPRRDGYRCLTLDICDQETLREKARVDPDISDALIPHIEAVDLVGSAGDLADLVPRPRLGTFDYVVSSHNFEHLPDPIAFLLACEKVLRPGGVLSMAVPDRRVCFDYFRPHTILTEWLEAYFEQRKAPNAAQVFTQEAYRSVFESDRGMLSGFSLEDHPDRVIPLEALKESLDDWHRERMKTNRDYRDTHCSAMTPASLECLIRDLNYLGLLRLRPLEISPVNGNEFYVHLENADADSRSPDHRRFYDIRRDLLHKINDEASANCRRSFTKPPVAGPDPNERISQLEAELAMLKASRSWRYTGWVRSVVSRLRKANRRQGDRFPLPAGTRGRSASRTGPSPST